METVHLTENEIRRRMERVFIQNEAATMPTYSKYICPELTVETIPVKAWAYSLVKKAVKQAEAGKRSKIYTSKPPDHVMAMPLKEQLLWEWKFREALRIQKRKSFWVELTGLNSKVLDDIALAVGVKFEKEVISQKEYNRRRNSKKTGTTTVDAIVMIDEITGSQSFTFEWNNIAESLSTYREAMENQSVYYKATVLLPRGRKTCCVLAANIKHMCQLLAVHYRRKINIIRVDIMEKKPQYRSYELWLSGYDFGYDPQCKGGVYVEKGYNKARFEIPRSSGSRKKDQEEAGEIDPVDIL